LRRPIAAARRLVRDETLPSLLPELHPSYEHLSYVHRADYVRMALLNRYGGVWLDLETVALRNFSSLFSSCTDDGMSVPRVQGVIGPLRPNTTTTRAWKVRLFVRLRCHGSVGMLRRGHGQSARPSVLSWFCPEHNGHALPHARTPQTGHASHPPTGARTRQA
jgi:hypothetical protein